MTEGEFRQLYAECSADIADRYYPKGVSDRRGEYLRDQAVLYTKLVAVLAARGVLDEI